METFLIVLPCYFCSAVMGGLIAGVILCKYFMKDFMKFTNTLLNEQYSKDSKAIKMLDELISKYPVRS